MYPKNLTPQEREAHEKAITWVVDSQNNYFGTADRKHIVKLYNEAYPNFLKGLVPHEEGLGDRNPTPYRLTWRKP